MPTKNESTIFKSNVLNLISAFQDPKNPLSQNSVDLIVTSPPYWTQRDYGHKDQIGAESTLDEYATTLGSVLENCKIALKPTGSLFINLGDTYVDKSLVGAPASVLQEALSNGWACMNTIKWAKTNAKPDPARDRLKNSTETIFWLTPDNKSDHVTTPDQFNREFGEGTVWKFPPSQSSSGHAAPYPPALVERTLAIAAPDSVCSQCNSPQVTNDPVTADRWGCSCSAGTEPPVVYDPFVGTGTTVETALKRGYNAIGSDLKPPDQDGEKINNQKTLSQF